MAAVIRAIVGYCFLIFMVRIVGRRPGKQITPFEYVLIFFLGGVTLTPMVSDDQSVTNAYCQIATIALMHSFLAWLKQRYPRFGKVIDGTPLVLYQKGQRQKETMNKMRIQDEDIMTMARDNAIPNMEKIDYATLERNGEISVIKVSDD